jgi:hypothetical protein
MHCGLSSAAIVVLRHASRVDQTTKVNGVIYVYPAAIQTQPCYSAKFDGLYVKLQSLIKVRVIFARQAR